MCYCIDTSNTWRNNHDFLYYRNVECALFLFNLYSQDDFFGPDSCVKPRDEKKEEETALRVKKQNEYDDYWGYVK